MTVTANDVARATVKPEEMAEWRQHPCTKAFLLDLQLWAQEGKDSWAASAFQRSDSTEATAMANAEALGGMQILNKVMEFLQGEEA